MKAGVIHNRFDSYEAIISVLLNLGRVEEALEYVERARSRNLLDLLGNTKIIGGDSTSQQLIQKEQALRAKISKLHSQISEDTNHGQGQVRGTTREVNVSSLQKTQREYQQLLLDLKLRNPEYASMINVVPLSSSQIQKLFDKETVLLEYFVTDDKTLIFVVTNDAVRVLTVPAGKASLRGKIVLFRGTAVRQMDEKKLSEMHWLPPLQRLYEILIEPVQKAGYLSSKKHLLIVPQGMLHYLPFQALVMRTKSESGEILRPHFLIEDYAVSYAPSASALKFCQKKNTASLGKLFLLAPRTSALPSSEEEVVGIALSFGSGVEYLLRDSATESIVKKRGRQFDVLHFATTARFNKANPLFSRLELAGSENDDGNLEVHEVFGLDLHANLVTLSACQTALGSGYSEEHPHGDDLVSLTRAFQYAGTPSVVASLWEVSDPSTAAFMQKFYGYLKKLNKVQALAQTQRDMITGKIFDKTKKNQNKYSHPYFWAPFVLVGDWK